MKHTFMFIDKLIYILSVIPPYIKSKSDQVKAKKYIDLMKEYAQILENLLINHKTEENLKKLHNAHIDDNWVEQIEKVLKKIESLLSIVKEDAEKLKNILENDHTKWRDALVDMHLSMVMTGLHDEEEEMLKLRKIAIFDTQKLEEIIKHKKHIEKLPVWQKIMGFEDEELKLISVEKYFIDLLS